MKPDDITIGSTYDCSSPILKESFYGIVEKVYDNAALLVLTEVDDIDKTRAEELNNRMIVPLNRFDRLIASAVVEEETKTEEDA
ncbi:hypothetical protein [Vagococcus coleopterorum]|nr:hypothetical protein [Vagococcus coleopterorum]